MICKKCGQETPDGSAYCQNCGEQMAYAPVKKRTSNAPIVLLILAIVNLLFFAIFPGLCTLIGVGFFIPLLIFCIKNNRRGASITGMTFSLVAVLLSSIFWGSPVSSVSSAPAATLAPKVSEATVTAKATPKVMEATATARVTPKVVEATATVRATPTKIPVLVEIRKVSFGEDILGFPFFSPDLYNGSDKPIDAVEINFRCENRFGEPLYTLLSLTNGGVFLYQESIEPGEGTGERYSCSLMNFDDTAILYLSIAKYHYKDGETIEIPEDQWQWIRFEKP